jgi:hypothetical protein
MLRSEEKRSCNIEISGVMEEHSEGVIGEDPLGN